MLWGGNTKNCTKPKPSSAKSYVLYSKWQSLITLTVILSLITLLTGKKIQAPPSPVSGWPLKSFCASRMNKLYTSPGGEDGGEATAPPARCLRQRAIAPRTTEPVAWHHISCGAIPPIFSLSCPLSPSRPFHIICLMYSMYSIHVCVCFSSVWNPLSLAALASHQRVLNSGVRGYLIHLFPTGQAITLVTRKVSFIFFFPLRFSA